MIRCNCKLILGLSDYENLATLHKAKKLCIGYTCFTDRFNFKPILVRVLKSFTLQVNTSVLH